jgi:hypothetical protein
MRPARLVALDGVLGALVDVGARLVGLLPGGLRLLPGGVCLLPGCLCLLPQALSAAPRRLGTAEGRLGLLPSQRLLPGRLLRAAGAVLGGGQRQLGGRQLFLWVGVWRALALRLDMGAVAGFELGGGPAPLRTGPLARAQLQAAHRRLVRRGLDRVVPLRINGALPLAKPLQAALRARGRLVRPGRLLLLDLEGHLQLAAVAEWGGGDAGGRLSGPAV